jgi:HNH endonuclease
MTSLADRLLSKIEIQEDGCWRYTGGLNGGGYGNIWDRGRTRSAHVVSYELSKGPVPEGMSVLHACDNRACVRPTHLFLGSTQDNINDMITKGRDGFKGIRNGRSLLVEEQVNLVKFYLRNTFLSQEAIADKFHVSRSTISAISTGRNW